MSLSYYAVRFSESNPVFTRIGFSDHRAYFRMVPEAVAWSVDNLGYGPRSIFYSDRKAGNRFWVKFDNADDAALFVVRFGR